MPIRMRVLGRILWVLGLTSSVFYAQSLQITSPADGTVVAPGQSVAVHVTAAGGPFQAVVILGGGPLGMSQILTAPPYDFTIQIPSNISPGRYPLTAAGFTTPGQGAKSEPIGIVVEPPGDPTSVFIQPSSLILWVGDVAPLHVTGKFPSGPPLDMTFSSRMAYGSGDPAIATIDNLGRVTAVAPGTTFVGVGFGPSVPVTVVSFIKLVPPAPILYAGQSVEFTAQVKIRSNQSATWSINPTNLGTLTSTGPDTARYTAPASVTTQKQVTVTTTSVADPTKSTTTTITLNPPVSVSISPANATLKASQTQQFTATVSNATYPGVTWSLTPAVGTITAAGLYAAPAAIPANQTIVVKATSNQDPSKSATANVNLRKSP